MAKTYLKRHYWGFKEYNPKTGLYKGETHTIENGNGKTYDWLDKEIEDEFKRSY